MNFESEWIEEKKEESLKPVVKFCQPFDKPSEEDRKVLTFLKFIFFYILFLFGTIIFCDLKTCEAIFGIQFFLGILCAIFQFIVKPIFYALTYVVVKTEKIGWEIFKRL